MFKDLYLSVDSKNNPDKELISFTKEKMYEELKREQRKKHINLYRYSAVAASIFLIISVFILIPGREFNSTIKEADITINLESYDRVEKINNDLPFAGNEFISGKNNSTIHNYFSPADGATLNNTNENIFIKFINFIKNAIQHLWEMLF